MSKVIMLCGRLCSGKTTYAAKLRGETGAVILSVDELMLSILGGDTGDMHNEYVRRTEKYLFAKAADIAAAGADVILDQGFWTRAERSFARSFFAERGISCELHYLTVSDEEWLRRIEERNKAVEAGKSSAYYVDGGLMEKFRSLFEPPAEDEADRII
ncbi:MAG: ATP-binding protein [Ruminococcus sp.]|nr:ATP-binding protein [Ruminococcus sp.]